MTQNFTFNVLFFLDIEMPFSWKEKSFRHEQRILSYFFIVLLNFEIFWTRIGQVIRL